MIVLLALVEVKYTRQALWAREKLGVRPLLICLTYPPEQVTKCGLIIFQI